MDNFIKKTYLEKRHTYMSVGCECCVLSGRVPCVGLITRSGESYRVLCAWAWSWSIDNGEALAH